MIPFLVDSFRETKWGGNRYSYVGNNPISSSDPTGNMVTADDRGGGGSPATPPNPFAGAKASISGLVVNEKNIFAMANYTDRFTGINPRSVAMGRTFLTTSDPAEFALSGLELVTQGGFSSLTNTVNKGVYETQRLNTIGDYDFGHRLSAYASVAFAGTMASFSITSAAGVKMPEWNLFGGEAQDMITIYKGMPADNLGKDIVPRAARDFDMGSGIIKQGQDPAAMLANMQRQGMSLKDIALAQANYSNQFSPALSWTTDMSVARDWAMKAACETGCGVIIQAQVLKSSGVFIPDLLRSGRLLNAPELTAKILAESEFTTFGIFPASGYTPIWTIVAAP